MVIYLIAFQMENIVTNPSLLQEMFSVSMNIDELAKYSNIFIGMFCFIQLINISFKFETVAVPFILIISILVTGISTIFSSSLDIVLFSISSVLISILYKYFYSSPSFQVSKIIDINDITTPAFLNFVNFSEK